MSERLFDKEDLKNLVYQDYDEDVWEVVEEELIDTSRWSTIHSMVFKYEGKFYETTFSRGATECQDESPYEYDADQIACSEVEPVEVVRIEYRQVK